MSTDPSESCSSDFDLISLEPWSEIPPNVFIKFQTNKDKPLITNCYLSDSLSVWLNDIEKKFARWVPKPKRTLNKEGHGGEPDLSETYIKLYTGEYILYDESVELLGLGLFHVTFETEYLGYKRIGNLAGTFGSSAIHGQSPGQPVYKLTKMKILNNEGEDKLDEILEQLEQDEIKLMMEEESKEEEETEDIRYFTQDISGSFHPLDTEDILDLSYRDLVVAKAEELRFGQVVILRNNGKVIQIYIKNPDDELPEMDENPVWKEISKETFEKFFDDNDVTILIDDR